MPQTESTNSLAKSLIEANIVFDGSIVVAANQLNGRGQRGNSWYSEPGKNLILSCVLRPSFLTGANTYWLYLTAALVVHNLLQKHCSDIKIKWPNDIFCSGKKIAGILIENSLKGDLVNWSVLGIGINVNQKDFGQGINATSVFLNNNKENDLLLMENELCMQLERFYLMLKAGKYEEIRQLYFENLLGFNEWRNYKSVSSLFNGKITDIDKEGHLVIEDEKGEKMAFGFKEIEFLF